MNWFQVALAIHVLAAVLGVGTVTAMAVIARDARGATDRLPSAFRLITFFSRFIQWALLVMLLSGLALLKATGWVYLHSGWFIAAFVLFLALGAWLGSLSRPLRKSGGSPDPAALTRLERVAWGSCVVVAVIVVLMAAKPG